MADQTPPPSIDPSGVPDPPDSTPYGTPTIKVDTWDIADPKPPNPNDFWADQAAENTFLTAYWKMRGWGVPRFIAWTLAGVGGLSVGLLAYAIAAGFWALTKIGAPFAEFIVGTIGAARKDLDPRLPILAADILGELTGAKIDPGNFPTGQGFADHLARVTAVGNQLHTVLETEFAPNGTITPDQGAQAARAFTGFNINFGIGTAFISLLGEMESLGFIKSFRELGEDVAKNLGLGRMHRQALQPLIKTLIADPYTWHMNAKYRPARLAKEQAIKKFFRTPQFKAQMMTELAQEGFSDDRIQDLIDDATPLLSDKQVVELFFRFNNSLDATKNALSSRGWGFDEAQQLIDLERPLLDRGEIAHLFQHGALSQADAIGYLAKLGYDATTADLVLKAHTFATTHTPVIHFGELRRLMQENVIDVLEFGARLRAQGYSDDDINLLTLDALHPTKSKEKMLPLAEIKAAYKAGLLNGAQAIADLENLGYSKTDATIIAGTFATAKKTTPTTPTTPAGG